MDYEVASFDVVVIGGGPGGAAAAIALSKASFHVCLIEKNVETITKMGESLAPSIRDPLESLGLFESFVQSGVLPSEGIQCNWGDKDFENDYFFNPYRNGWQVNRKDFDSFLIENAKTNNVAVCFGTKLVAVETQDDKWKLTVNVGSKRKVISCHFVIDASGRSRAFVRHVDAKVIQIDNLVGVGAKFKNLLQDEILTPIIEASKNGWWYFAPIPGKENVVVFFTDPDIVRKTGIWKKEQWIQSLRETKKIEKLLSANEDLGKLRTYSVSSSSLVDPVGLNWVAIGDTANSFDPLSAQGVEFALRSAIKAAIAVSAPPIQRRLKLREYGSAQRKLFINYMVMRKHFYGLEKRWPESSFWRRRQVFQNKKMGGCYETSSL
jgi:flavin-dependent dehydrogenase